jgi:hypothetical protein
MYVYIGWYEIRSGNVGGVFLQDFFVSEEPAASMF